jgi:hypothetical protein
MSAVAAPGALLQAGGPYQPNFSTEPKKRYDRRHRTIVMRLTAVERTVSLGATGMTARPIRPGPVATATSWHAGSSTYTRGYLLASLRAGLIALVLLTILLAIVLI